MTSIGSKFGVRSRGLVLTMSLWVLLGTSRIGAQDVIISEFLASNDTGRLDADGESSDWLELCNRTGSVVDIGGWGLSDDPTDPFRWVFSAGTSLPASGKLLVFASGKDRRTGELHTNFGINSEGEYLGLTRGDGTTAWEYSPTFPPQRADISYGVVDTAANGGGESLAADLTWKIPTDDSDGLAWTQAEFDDGDWNPAGPDALPLGYDRGAAAGGNIYAAVVRDTEGLVAYWRLGESAGAIALDETGAHSGAYQNGFELGAGGVVVGDPDTAADFDRGWVTVPADPALDMGPAAFSLEVWMQPDASDVFQWIVSKGTSNVDFLLGITSANQFRFITQGLNNVATVAAPAPFDGQRWFHVVGVQDPAAEVVRLYINGESAATIPLVQGVGDAFRESSLDLGARAFLGGNQGLDGRLDEVALYNRALSSSEVQSHFHGATNPAGLEALIQTNVETAMYGVNASAYLRLAFDVEDRTALDGLFMNIAYDDGFIAYLNGQEVARGNAPENPSWNAAATSDRHREIILQPEALDLSGALDALHTGRNVLAVHLLNDVADGDEVFLDVSLRATGLLTPLYFTNPTPGAPNGPGILGFAEITSITPTRGFYDSARLVEITVEPADATLRFTTDGSRPTAARGTVYSGPIAMDSTTTLRVAAFKEGYLPSAVETRTYLFPNDIIRQTGAEFPSTWNGVTADYAMDPNVVNNQPYSATIRDDLKAIPSVSVVMSKADLFGSGGVYSNPEQRGRAWERPCSVEFFDPNTGEEFHINAGLRAHGGSSRSPSITPQHSLRLHFRSEYGAGRLRFPLFHDNDIESFDSLVLSANSSDNWTSANTATGVVGQFFRDQWVHDTHRDMGHVHIAGRFAHLYLNGLYWGLYVVQERVDDDFAASHFGGREEEYDVIVDEVAFRGNSSAWSQLLGHVRSGNYAAVAGLMDVDNFADYMIANMFTGNWDWPDHNWHAVRRRLPGERFHFVVWDAEVGLGLDVNIPGPIRPNVLTVNLTGSRADVSSSSLANGPGEIYNRLRGNAEFQIRFADRLQKHLFHDGVLTPARSIANYEARAEEIEAALVGEAARWGDVRREPPSVPDGRWTTERNWIVNTFFPRRPDTVIDQWRRVGLFPDTQAPQFNQHGGRIQPGFTLQVTSASGTPYFTLNGDDPRQRGGAVLPGAISGGSVQTVLLVDDDAAVRVHVPPDGTLGLSWTAIDFDDTGWQKGQNGVGYDTGSGYEAFINTDIIAETYQKHPTFYMRQELTVASDTLNDFTSLSLLMRYDDGFVAYLNGQRVASANAPANPAWNSTSTSGHPDSLAVEFQLFDITDALQHLRAGRNVLAVQGLNTSPTSGDMLIMTRLTGGIPQEDSGVRLNRTTVVKARALDTAEWSPLSEVTFATDTSLLRVTEIMYNPAPAPEGVLGNDQYEFLELQNVGTRPLHLLGARFDAGIEFTFPATTPADDLAPGEFVLIVKNQAAFESRYDTSGMYIAGEYDGNLSNGGENLRLVDALGETILDFTYLDTWYPSTDGQGRSLHIEDARGDPELWNDQGFWFPSFQDGGTPGTGRAVVDGGRQFPADINQDGDLDISDAVGLLLHLFAGVPAVLPCEGGTIADSGNLALLDSNGDASVNLADAVYVLGFLFGGGPEPVLGTVCVPLEGCPEACTP